MRASITTLNFNIPGTFSTTYISGFANAICLKKCKNKSSPVRVPFMSAAVEYLVQGNVPIYTSASCWSSTVILVISDSLIL